MVKCPFFTLKDNGNKFFYLPSDYEYCIIFYPNCLVLELIHSEHSIRPPSWIDFQKIIFTGHDLCDVRCREESKHEIYFIMRISRFLSSGEKFGGFRLYKLKIFTIIKEIGYYPINLNLNQKWRQATAMTRATRKKRVNRTTKSTICLRPKMHGALSWCGHWVRALHVKAKSHSVVLLSR